MSTATVTREGQITLPDDIRHYLGIQAGSQIILTVVGDHAELRVAKPSANPSTSGFGLLKSTRPAIPADFDPASLFSVQE